MTFSAQRGAQPITLDKPRTLFFDASATFILHARYGLGYAAKLYKVIDTGTPDAEGKQVQTLELADAEALPFFLHAGLQAEAIANGEALTLAQCAEFIRPWTLPTIFAAVFQAFRGALYVPPVKEGKDEAAPVLPNGRKPKPYAKKTVKKVSTTTTPSGLRSPR